MNRSSDFVERLKELAGEEAARQLLQEFGGDLLAIPRPLKGAILPANETRASVIYEGFLSQLEHLRGLAKLLRALVVAHEQHHAHEAFVRLTITTPPPADTDLPATPLTGSQSSAQAPKSRDAAWSLDRLASPHTQKDYPKPAPSPFAHDLDSSLDAPAVVENNDSTEIPS